MLSQKHYALLLQASFAKMIWCWMLLNHLVLQLWLISASNQFNNFQETNQKFQKQTQNCLWKKPQAYYGYSNRSPPNGWSGTGKVYFKECKILESMTNSSEFDFILLVVWTEIKMDGLMDRSSHSVTWFRISSSLSLHATLSAGAASIWAHTRIHAQAQRARRHVKLNEELSMSNSLVSWSVQTIQNYL